MLADRLSKAWEARRKAVDIDAVMRFSDEGLVLGAGTVLAPSGGSDRDVSVDPLEPRLRALLAAAHLTTPTVGALAHLRKASERWSEGKDALAAMHLALSGLERLQQPGADAHRLFLADGLLKGGTEADAIIGAIEAGGPALERLYNPNQPRVPAGNGIISGQWTTGDGSSGDAQPEVNPNTVTPAVSYPVGHPYTGHDACLVAERDCYRYVIDQAAGIHANDNWKDIEGFACLAAGIGCVDLGLVIERVRGLDRGGAIFPSGGLVVLEKGKQDLYIPRAYRGGIPPFRRGV